MTPKLNQRSQSSNCKQHSYLKIPILVVASTWNISTDNHMAHFLFHSDLWSNVTSSERPFWHAIWSVTSWHSYLICPIVLPSSYHYLTPQGTQCLVIQSCPTLCNPMDCSPPGSSVHGILQARILEWVATPSSRGSSQPRDQTQGSHVASGFFTIWAQWKPIFIIYLFPLVSLTRNINPWGLWLVLFTICFL